MAPASTGCIAPQGYTLAWPQGASSEDACGKPIARSVGGVNVSAERLCLMHWTLKHGHADLKAPIEVEE
jgi:hypothetical protein